LTSARAVPLEIIDQVIEAFRNVDGFEMSALTIAVSPRSTLEGRQEHEEITRSLHYGLDGVCSHVKIHGLQRTPWARSVGKGLAQAGYELRWAVDDERGFRRWLIGAREIKSELRLLKAMGEHGSPPRWPDRHATSQPVRSRTFTASDWTRVLGVVRSTDLHWNGCAQSLSRRVRLPGEGVMQLVLDVSAVIFSFPPAKLSRTVCIRLFDPSHDNMTVPRSVARPLCGELLRAGYQRRRVRGQIFATKVARSLGDVVRECSRIVPRIVERINQSR